MKQSFIDKRLVFLMNFSVDFQPEHDIVNSVFQAGWGFEQTFRFYRKETYFFRFGLIEKCLAKSGFSLWFWGLTIESGKGSRGWLVLDDFWFHVNGFSEILDW